MNVHVGQATARFNDVSFQTLLSQLERTAQERDVSGAIDDASRQAIVKSGLPVWALNAALDRPETAQELLDVLRKLGRVDLSVARLLEGHVNAAVLIRRFGSKAQQTRFESRIGAGELSGVWGADDAKGLLLRQEADCFVLEGRKILASGAGLLGAPIVIAKWNGAQFMILLESVPTERIDLMQWTAQGMRASATGAVELTGIPIAADQIIGGADDFTCQPNFAGGAWRFCAVHLGAMERLVDLFREQLRQRKRGEDPYQLERIAACAAATIGARHWIEGSAFALAREAESVESIVARAHMTRMVTERAALEVLELVHRGVGLQSFLRPSPIERIGRDLATYLRQPAPDAAMAAAARFIGASDLPIGALWE